MADSMPFRRWPSAAATEEHEFWALRYQRRSDLGHPYFAHAIALLENSDQFIPDEGTAKLKEAGQKISTFVRAEFAAASGKALPVPRYTAPRDARRNGSSSGRAEDRTAAVHHATPEVRDANANRVAAVGVSRRVRGGRRVRNRAPSLRAPRALRESFP